MTEHQPLTEKREMKGISKGEPHNVCYFFEREHVRSAVEGLRQELSKRPPPSPSDLRWQAGHDKATQRALYLLDKYFPVFAEKEEEMR